MFSLRIKADSVLPGNKFDVFRLLALALKRLHLFCDLLIWQMGYSIHMFRHVVSSTTQTCC